MASNSVEKQIEELLRFHIKGCNAKSIDNVMSTFHPNSPVFLQSKDMYVSIFKKYDLTQSIEYIKYIGCDEDYAIVRVKFKTIKVSGPEFRDNILDAIIVFKQKNKLWRIWTQSNCDVLYI